MKLTNVIFGMIITTIGVMIGYIDYIIISSFYNISVWISDILNAPESLATILTLVLIWIFIGLIIVIVLVAIYMIICGLSLILSD